MCPTSRGETLSPTNIDEIYFIFLINNIYIVIDSSFY